MVTRQSRMTTGGSMGALTTAIAFFRTAKTWLQRGWPTP